MSQIPRFAFEKFPGATPTLTTQMKSVGEAMAMGRTFQESFQKALRSLETGLSGWSLPKNWKRKTRQQLEYNLRVPNPERMVYIKQVCPIDLMLLAMVLTRWHVYRHDEHASALSLARCIILRSRTEAIHRLSSAANVVLQG